MMLNRTAMKCCALFLWAVVTVYGTLAAAQDTFPEGAPALPTRAEIAAEPDRFLRFASLFSGWEEPAAPFHVAGPIYFVGTKGLSVWLITTSDGSILINTGMPSSADMILQSIRDLGFDPSDIRLMLAGHAHIDHVGAMAVLAARTGAKVALMEADVALAESGGAADFSYANALGFRYAPVTVDRILRDGDRIVLGDVTIQALATPGHTRGCTTFVMEISDNGQTYRVVFPDGMGVNPGYGLRTDPSYPGIEADYRSSFRTLETLRPDIWLPAHVEVGRLFAKRDRAATEGPAAYVDPEGFRHYILAQRTEFETLIDAEIGLTPIP